MDEVNQLANKARKINNPPLDYQKWGMNYEANMSKMNSLASLKPFHL